MTPTLERMSLRWFSSWRFGSTAMHSTTRQLAPNSAARCTTPTCSMTFTVPSLITRLPRQKGFTGCGRGPHRSRPAVGMGLSGLLTGLAGGAASSDQLHTVRAWAATTWVKVFFVSVQSFPVFAR